jgi:hypothetical protein
VFVSETIKLAAEPVNLVLAVPASGFATDPQPDTVRYAGIHVEFGLHAGCHEPLGKVDVLVPKAIRTANAHIARREPVEILGASWCGIGRDLVVRKVTEVGAPPDLVRCARPDHQILEL